MDKNIKSQGILKGTAIIGSLTLVSRIVGFVRDLLLARLFGAGLNADAFFVAFRIPNTLRNFAAEGALTAGFIPVFSQELKKGREEAQRCISEVAGFMLAATIFLSLLGIIFSNTIVSLFAPGFHNIPGKHELCVTLTRIMFPYIACVSVVALVGGALNTVKVFGTAAIAQVVMNIVFILGAIVAGRYESNVTVILAWFVLVGGLLQILLQFPFLKRGGFSLSPIFTYSSKTVRSVLKLMLPAMFGAAVYQCSIFVNTILASLLKEGSVSWLFYADRIAQFPVGIFSIALGSVLLPALATAAAEKDNSLFTRNIIDSLRFTTFLMLPVACGIFILAEPITILLFERGAFTRASSIQTAHAIQAYSVGIWGVSAHTMIVRAFIARHDTKTPMFTGMIIFSLSLILSLSLMGSPVFEEGNYIYQITAAIQQGILTTLPFMQSINLGHIGLALSASIATTLGFFILCFKLHRDVSELAWKKFLQSFFKSALVSVIMVFVILITGSNKLEPIWAISTTATLGITIFCLSHLALKTVEFRETLKILKRK